ncbi:MAG TPA: hypothetical protein VMR98_05975 [Candidatus Polarisedimenticolaceae bacterium]|nr:hypothetical protein [Candidatus Polarisedimenticolaceae bacterium]
MGAAYAVDSELFLYEWQPWSYRPPGWAAVVLPLVVVLASMKPLEPPEKPKQKTLGKPPPVPAAALRVKSQLGRLAQI